VSFLANLAHTSLPSTFVLYAAYRYGWGERAVGLTLAGVGVCSAVVQGTLVGPLVSRLGERRAMLLGLTAGALGFAIYGFAETGLVFVLGAAVMALWGISGPAAQGLMTRAVDPSEQGRLQGALGSLTGIAELIGPGLFTLVFAASIAESSGVRLPGSAFLLSAALLAAAAALAFRITRSAAAGALPVADA
jgi:MFS transporter, DHA1 family, tetracycline resistance protein